MRITIEIDGLEVASHTVAPAVEQHAEQAAAPASGLEEVYAKAAASGAIDAGPAPSMEGTSMAQGGAESPAGQLAPHVFIGAGSADQSAGAAPQLAPESGTY